jgi:hypothetical protein
VVDNKEGGCFEIAWSYQIADEKESVYFAFTFPYGYDECQQSLIEMDEKFGVKEVPSFNHETNGWEKWINQSEKPNDMFYYRQLLNRSLDGRRVDLITISDWSDLMYIEEGDDEEENNFGLCESHAHMSDLHPSVFPDVVACLRPHPPKFKSSKKRVVFLTARVHPGETPASHCLNGSLTLLTHPTDQRAIALRRHFVFKIVIQPIFLRSNLDT